MCIRLCDESNLELARVRHRPVVEDLNEKDKESIVEDRDKILY